MLTRDEMLTAPHFCARGVVTAGYDGLPVAAHPVRFDHRPALAPEAPPAPGQHQQEGWLQG
ncbi:MAG: hypothetical protein C4321_08735 [Chloroflexota bacterium]